MAGRRRSPNGTWVVVGVLLAIGIIVPLLVGIYDKTDPTLFGFPFFYWFQFALIPVVSILTYIAFKVSQRATFADREHAGLRGKADEQ